MIHSTLILIAISLGLSGCFTAPGQSGNGGFGFATAPPQHQFTADGRACKRVGYSFNPYYIDPRTSMVC